MMCETMPCTVISLMTKRHTQSPLTFVIQKKAFNNITVSLVRVAALFTFPVVNDKGVASSLNAGCPEHQNQNH